MAGTGQKATLLIVDDEDRLRNALARSFRQAGYQIRVAACGEEALAVLAAEPAELVITDLVMPGMDGLALVRALQTGALPPKVLILTAYGTAESQAEAQALGVDGYLSKPFDLAQLKSRVHQLLRSPAGGRGGGWAVRSGYVICAAAGQALGVLAGLPRKMWSCVQPEAVGVLTGRAMGAVAEVWSGVRRRIAETR